MKVVSECTGGRRPAAVVVVAKVESEASEAGRRSEEANELRGKGCELVDGRE